MDGVSSWAEGEPARRCAWTLAAVALALAAISLGCAQDAAATPTTGALRLSIPKPTGPYRVGTRALEMVDRSRPAGFGLAGPRRLMVQVTYPRARNAGRCRPAPYAPAAIVRRLLAVIELTGPTKRDTHECAGGPVAHRRLPLLVFSHAYTADRFVYTAMISDLASRGYIVVAPDHTSDAFAVQFPGGHVVNGVFGTPLASKPEPAATLARLERVRVADVRFVLTRVERMAARQGDFLSGRVDPREVGILGHSLGGATAALAALRDRRFDAAADIDGSLFGDWARRARGDTPFLLMASQYGVGAEFHRDLLCPYYKRLRGPRDAIELPGTRHLAFSDFQALAPQIAAQDPSWAFATAYPAVIGTLPSPESIAAQRLALARFFDTYVRHDARRFTTPRAYRPLVTAGPCTGPPPPVS